MAQATKKPSFQKIDHGALEVLVNLAVTSEGFAALGMAAHRTDCIGVLHVLIDAADEGAARHVATCDLVERLQLMLSSQRIKNRHLPVQPCQFECFLDIDIVFLLANEWKQGVAFLVMVLLKQSQCRFIQWHYG